MLGDKRMGYSGPADHYPENIHAVQEDTGNAGEGRKEREKERRRRGESNENKGETERRAP